MRNVLKVGVGLLLLLLVGGLVAISLNRVRNAAGIAQCQNNLRAIGMALQQYHNVHGQFPTGTLPNPKLLSERRFSWVSQIYPTYMVGGVCTLLDKSKAWDAEENWPSREFYPKSEGRRQEVVEEPRVLLCPANGARTEAGPPGRMSYLGIAGLGDDAAELPLSDPRTGFFGYDRTVTLRDVKDGTSVTLAVVEAMGGGPWTAGGRATVRALVPGEPPYLGAEGQFSTPHREGGVFPLTQPVVTNALFVDGSVHRLTTRVSPQVFEALATIAGGEEVTPVGE
jgi:hypothetical protein